MVISLLPHVFPTVTRTFQILHVPQTFRTHTLLPSIETRWTLPLPWPLPLPTLLWNCYQLPMYCSVWRNRQRKRKSPVALGNPPILFPQSGLLSIFTKTNLNQHWLLYHSRLIRNTQRRFLMRQLQNSTRSLTKMSSSPLKSWKNQRSTFAVLGDNSLISQPSSKH